MSDLDRDYFERRRDACLAHAAAASDPGIARIHREFAALYERRLEPGQVEKLRVVASR
jgi:hypothetical protein